MASLFRAEQPKVPAARSAEQVEAALTRELTLEFVETPLTQIVDYLQDQTGLLIVRHTEQVHRQIHDLLLELDVYRQPASMSLGHLGSGL